MEAPVASMKNMVTQRAKTPRRLPFPESPDIERLIHPDAVTPLIDADPILDRRIKSDKQEILWFITIKSTVKN